MNRTVNLSGMFLIAALVCAAGCSTTHPSDESALQGTWQGQEIGTTTPGTCSLVVSGRNFEFHAADPNEWYKGTFTLREETLPKQLIAAITACPAADYVGKTDRAIYRLENGTLTLAAFEPGTPSAPESFEAPNARRFVLKRK